MKVAIVVLEGVQALHVAGLLHVFSEANTFLDASHRYQVTLIGEHGGYVSCSNAMQLLVPLAYTDVHECPDVLLVTGGSRASTCRANDAFVPWLRARALQAKRFGSVCSGAYLLGHAGLLDDKEVTARWADASSIARTFPRARVRPDKLLIRDGCMRSSAGANAGLNLCLSLVAEDWGLELVKQIECRLGADVEHDGAQSQNDRYVTALADESAAIGKVRRYVHDHIAEALSIEQLAAAVSISRRTLSRLFAKYLQMTPSAFLEEARVGAASQLLAQSDIPLKTVAFKCGFHNATHMRMVFLRRLDATPQHYRQRVRGTQGTLRRLAPAPQAQPHPVYADVEAFA